jgi:hypothetical protein
VRREFSFGIQDFLGGKNLRIGEIIARESALVFQSFGQVQHLEIVERNGLFFHN